MLATSLLWGFLACLCLWPPISTLLPKVETETGWKIKWDAFLDIPALHGGGTQSRPGMASPSWGGGARSMLAGLQYAFSMLLPHGHTHAGGGGSRRMPDVDSLDPQQPAAAPAQALTDQGVASGPRRSTLGNRIMPVDDTGQPSIEMQLPEHGSERRDGTAVQTATVEATADGSTKPAAAGGDPGKTGSWGTTRFDWATHCC